MVSALYPLLQIEIKFTWDTWFAKSNKPKCYRWHRAVQLAEFIHVGITLNCAIKRGSGMEM